MQQLGCSWGKINEKKLTEKKKNLYNDDRSSSMFFRCFCFVLFCLFVCLFVCDVCMCICNFRLTMNMFVSDVASNEKTEISISPYLETWSEIHWFGQALTPK